MGEMTFFKKSKKETTIFSKKKKKTTAALSQIEGPSSLRTTTITNPKKKNYRRNSHLNSVAEFYIHNSEIDLLPLE
jgi:hypothetical protein